MAAREVVEIGKPECFLSYEEHIKYRTTTWMLAATQHHEIALQHGHTNQFTSTPTSFKDMLYHLCAEFTDLLVRSDEVVAVLPLGKPNSKEMFISTISSHADNYDDQGDHGTLSEQFQQYTAVTDNTTHNQYPNPTHNRDVLPALTVVATHDSNIKFTKDFQAAEYLIKHTKAFKDIRETEKQKHPKFITDIDFATHSQNVFELIQMSHEMVESPEEKELRRLAASGSTSTLSEIHSIGTFLNRANKYVFVSFAEKISQRMLHGTRDGKPKHRRNFFSAMECTTTDLQNFAMESAVTSHPEGLQDLPLTKPQKRIIKQCIDMFSRDEVETNFDKMKLSLEQGGPAFYDAWGRLRFQDFLAELVNLVRDDIDQVVRSKRAAQVAKCTNPEEEPEKLIKELESELRRAVASMRQLARLKVEFATLLKNHLAWLGGVLGLETSKQPLPDLTRPKSPAPATSAFMATPTTLAPTSQTASSQAALVTPSPQQPFPAITISGPTAICHSPQFTSSPVLGDQSISTQGRSEVEVSLKNLDLADTSKLQNLDNETDNDEDEKEEGQSDGADELDKLDDWATAAFGWLNLVSKHQTALMSLMRKTSKKAPPRDAYSTVVQNLSLENIVVAPSQEDLHMQQPSAFLEEFRTREGKPLSAAQSKVLLQTMRGLPNGPLRLTGTWHCETILMSLHLLAQKRENCVATTELSEAEKRVHPLLLPPRSVTDRFMEHYKVLPISKGSCPACNSLMAEFSHSADLAYPGNHAKWSACAIPNWLPRDSAVVMLNHATEALQNRYDDILKGLKAQEMDSDPYFAGDYESDDEDDLWAFDPGPARKRHCTDKERKDREMGI